ncbi:MAG: zinc dependent phospholipase C family protein [Colwellia sp.]
MPKEVTHWMVANEIYKNLPNNSPFKNYINKHQDVFLLGAVLHDALYYYTGDKPHIKTLPDKMHCSNKEDSYEIINSILSYDKNLSQDQIDIQMAFIAGILSHIHVDSAFHPFIYYYTGNYYHPNPVDRQVAMKQHRSFESLLDLYLAGEQTACKAFDLGEISSSALTKLTKVFASPIKIDNFAMEVDIKDITNCFKNYTLARKIYSSKILSNFLSIVKRFLPSNLKIVLGLSYFNIDLINPINFGEKFSYVHPVSGDEKFTSIQQLKALSIEKCIDTLASISKEVTIHSGCSLETGLANSSVVDMKYFYKHRSS